MGWCQRKKERYQIPRKQFHFCICTLSSSLVIRLRRIDAAIHIPLMMNKAKRFFREWWMMNRHHPPYTLAPFKAARGEKNTEHLYYFPSDIVWSVLCCFMKIHLDDSPEISRDTAQRLSDLLVWPISQTFVKVCGVSSQRTLCRATFEQCFSYWPKQGRGGHPKCVPAAARCPEWADPVSAPWPPPDLTGG